MLDRTLIAVVIVACGVVGWVVFNRLSLRRMAALSVSDPLLADVAPNTPVIVYFTTPTCAPCRTLQSPALAQLKADLDVPLQIIQIDASQQTDVADRWGVFSAPTTFVLDQHRVLHHVNRGVASADTLKRQLTFEPGS